VFCVICWVNPLLKYTIYKSSNLIIYNYSVKNICNIFFKNQPFWADCLKQTFPENSTSILVELSAICSTRILTSKLIKTNISSRIDATSFYYNTHCIKSSYQKTYYSMFFSDVLYADFYLAWCPVVLSGCTCIHCIGLHFHFSYNLCSQYTSFAMYTLCSDSMSNRTKQEIIKNDTSKDCVSVYFDRERETSCCM